MTSEDAYMDEFTKLVNIPEKLIIDHGLITKINIRGDVITLSEPALVLMVGRGPDYARFPIIFCKREESKWIPISEKLPLNKEYVLVTTKDGVVAQAEFFSAELFEIYVERSIYVLDIDDVLAWMPMPKSYKAESEGHE